MAKMQSGVRSPTAHRTKEQAKAEWQRRSPAKKKLNAERKAARRTMEKEGKVSKGDGKDVDHKRPLSKGGSNSRSNLRVSSASKNRGHGMSPGGTKMGTRAKRG